jgi:hypothetical protein
MVKQRGKVKAELMRRIGFDDAWKVLGSKHP